MLTLKLGDYGSTMTGVPWPVIGILGFLALVALFALLVRAERRVDAAMRRHPAGKRRCRRCLTPSGEFLCPPCNAIHARRLVEAAERDRTRGAS